jgi:predicted transcriptional regulator
MLMSMTQNRSKLVALKSHFIKFPSQLIFMDISHTALRVYCYLCSNQDSFHPSMGHIGRCIGMSSMTVFRAIKELRHAGIIEKVSVNHLQVAQYAFKPPSNWKCKRIKQVAKDQPFNETVSSDADSIITDS